MQPHDLRRKLIGGFVVEASLALLLAVAAAWAFPADKPDDEGVRSGQWPRVRAEHLVREPCCAACGSKSGLVVHHIHPVHLWPEEELLESNLITLCEVHHLVFGHLGDYRSYNVRVRADCEEYRQRVERRPYKRINHPRLAPGRAWCAMAG